MVHVKLGKVARHPMSEHTQEANTLPCVQGVSLSMERPELIMLCSRLERGFMYVIKREPSAFEGLQTGRGLDGEELQWPMTHSCR